MVEAAAIVFSFIIVLVVLFQCALALGIPWGEYAMGGSVPGKFPPTMRIAALGQGLALIMAGLVVLIQADIVLSDWKGFSDQSIWFVVGLMSISSVLNLITKSKWEKRIWFPVTILLLSTSLLVAIG